MKTRIILLALLVVASSPAMADAATPSLASTQAISVALLTQGTTECSIDSPRIDDVLRSLVDGPRFPAVAHTSDDAVSFQFLVIVTATPQSKSPGINPTARDRTTTC